MKQKYTRTYTYLLPYLAKYVEIDKSKLVDVYLGITNITKNFDGRIYCLFSEVSEDYKQILVENPNFSEYQNNIYIFNFPNNELYRLFILGKYSKFPSSYKKDILKYHGLTYKSRTYKILTKHKDLYEELERKIGVTIDREQEIGVKISFEEEVYNPDVIITNTE